MTVHVSFRKSLPFRIPEWVMAAMMLLWGWMVLTNPTMFAANPSFNGMAAILPQEGWGSAATLLGVAGLIGLGINGFWVATPFIRAASSFGRAFLWLQIEFGLMAAGQATTGTAIYIGLVLLEGWNIYRAMGDARVATS
jgi:hypothetical protein